MTTTHLLGMPRIGMHRELKIALETFWAGRSDEAALHAVARQLRTRNWAAQKQSGTSLVTVGDFAFYDHLHNLTLLFSAAPGRFGCGESLNLQAYFAMARGTPQQPALAMKKWFDTNYHYLVPELSAGQQFTLNREWLLPEVREALALKHRVKVALPGPLTYLWLSACESQHFDRLTLLPRLLNAYAELLQELQSLGVAWVQLDEPVLSLDLPSEWLRAFAGAYERLTAVGLPVMLATYFGSVAEHAPLLKSLSVAGLHLDLVRAPDQLETFLADWPDDKILSLGVVDGRNIWRADLARVLSRLHPVRRILQERLWISASCSLLHVPVDLALEQKLDPQIKSWMAFAAQKLDELSVLQRALDHGEQVVWRELHAASTAIESRRNAPSTLRADVRAVIQELTPKHMHRAAPFTQRVAEQQEALKLPPLPTTTIGSFPQTTEIRAARAAFKQGKLTSTEYTHAMEGAIREAVKRQEALDIDVLVHGEAERNDMVEYFGEQLDGFVFTEHGWVQSYGSRCVKPPIIYGDVARPAPMTVKWTQYAQSLTSRPMKGMLTGPITLLCWSFVRDDLPRRDVAIQLALALRDEVGDLEAAGIRVIQIDEPAIREGMPLRAADGPEYLLWATRAFRISASGVRNATQIHTHMCYSQFNDILPSIAAMDADVITIETSRSRMALLDAFADFHYPNGIGPGIYDIHSPRVPPKEEMTQLLRRALSVVPAERLWVNPDCGLKTRGWEETEAALSQMVATAKELRAELAHAKT